MGFEDYSNVSHFIIILTYVNKSNTDYLDNFEDTTNYANVIFSDNNGDTWSVGGRMPFGVDPLWRPIHSGESMVCGSVGLLCVEQALRKMTFIIWGEMFVVFRNKNCLDFFIF